MSKKYHTEGKIINYFVYHIMHSSAYQWNHIFVFSPMAKPWPSNFTPSAVKKTFSSELPDYIPLKLQLCCVFWSKIGNPVYARMGVDEKVRINLGRLYWYWRSLSCNRGKNKLRFVVHNSWYKCHFNRPGFFEQKVLRAFFLDVTTDSCRF